MRIPLDYYRILGLPLQATAEQLQQAHRDRSLQLPRREYSEVAIAARKHLIDRAYGVLADPEQRRLYEASFLDPQPYPDSSPPTDSQDSYTPTLEIEEQHLVGALLILLELGEYELVLKLGRPSLSPRRLDPEAPREAQLARADISLTVALACLELGREQWQQGTYETAAESLETGHKLLLQEGLFPSVRGEIQADLYKLRPYRILELLALPEEKVIKRRQGLQMLKDMLHERGGVDGTSDDQSGLGIDDFLRFIQQLRGYLTSLEQQTLFEAEAQRPSAVATYLAVYALLARGFAMYQPDLIARAKRMLNRLASRQDVHLEQAVAALLLGQTEEASRALELSHEYEPLAFIREHSQGSPDLLPGLCLYGERWLQEEVFPHFRDLQNAHTTLKDYFLNERVQAALEAMPGETERPSEWTAIANQPQTTPSNGYASLNEVAIVTNQRGGTATLAPRTSSALTTETTVERASSETLAVPSAASAKTPPPATRLPIQDAKTYQNRRLGGGRPSSGDRHNKSPLAKIAGKLSPLQWLLLAAAGLLGLWVLGMLLSAVWGGISRLFTPAPLLQGEQLQVQLDRPPVAIPDPAEQPLAATGPITVPVAQQVVEAWLAAKAESFGPNYNTQILEGILVEPALSKQKQQAEAARQEGWYANYEHTVTIDGVEMSTTDPNQATVEATVQEKADFYQGSQLDTANSYDDQVRVQYRLIRQNDQWRIQDMALL